MSEEIKDSVYQHDDKESERVEQFKWATWIRKIGRTRRQNQRRRRRRDTSITRTNGSGDEEVDEEVNEEDEELMSV